MSAKINPLCFSILGLCKSTSALQFSPILRNKFWKNLKEQLFFFNWTAFNKQKIYDVVVLDKQMAIF